MITTKTGQREAKGKALASGLVVASLVVAGLLLTARPAHAATTGTRRSPSSTRESRSRAVRWSSWLATTNRADHFLWLVRSRAPTKTQRWTASLLVSSRC